GVDGDQEVFLVPVLADGKSVGDHIARHGADKDDEVGFFEEIVGGLRATITHRTNVGGRIERDRALGTPFDGTGNVVVLEPFGQLFGRFVGPVVATGNEEWFFGGQEGIVELDRKSTRLNSNHVSISYAVCCLKKKRRF